VRAANGWPLDRRLCLYVGRLSEEKGVLELIDAWRQLAAPDWTLVLIGPDMGGHALDVGPRAKALVAQCGLSSSVIFHGEATDTATLLRAADLYVQPSHYESFSNALVEAMGTGLPVVATRIGGMLDCIVDGENGLLCRPKDAADLAVKLRRLMTDGDLAALLAARARETVVADFNEDRILRKFETLFDGLAS
jgi:glycosyltransferase involved in cell wall biosynthesis